MFRRKVPFLPLLVLIPIIGLTACGGVAASPATAAAPQTTNAPTVTLTATPATVTSGQISTLSWTTSGASSVSISPIVVDDESNQPLPLSGQRTVMPTDTTTYVAIATGPGGTATASATVTVKQTAPMLTFTVSPASIIAGQHATLSWLAQNATSITVDNGIGSVAVPNGTQDVAPTVTTTYTATATGPGGAKTATATVQIAQQLAVTLTANPILIASGQSSTLTWQSQNAVSMTISPTIPGCTSAPCAMSLSGSVKVSPTQTTTYTVTAKDASGHIFSAMANVSVLVHDASLTNLKHIIFFVQENHSFDNYFGMLGAYKASKGFANDVDGLPSDAVQYDQLKVPVHPYHFQTVCTEGVSPSWNPSWGAYDLTGYTLEPGNGIGGYILSGGTPGMDGFVNDKDLPSTIDPEYHRVMGYYDQTDIPYYYEAATQFATSDRFFASAMAGTIPNRMYLFTGTSFGHVHPDPQPPGGWTQYTIFQLLSQYGVSWRYYYLDSSVFLGEWSIWGDPAIMQNVSYLNDATNGWYTALASPTADTDLPSVIFIDRGSDSGLDEHPGNNIQVGVATAVNIINALLASPAWKSSVLIFTWDEFSGFYDHVAPMAGIPAPDNILPILSSGFETPLPGDFVHSSFRVPLIVFSPWVKPHFVSHTPREFTSILKLIETRFGLPALTARDAWADDMTEFFDFTTPAWLTPPPLPAQSTNGVCDVTKELAGQN